ncbi:MAG: PepSY domain-containing protein [Clostridia bacterium]|nr:PepSY domain-containing protein [Clostridia bacterium]
MDEHRMFDAIADIDESIIDKCLTDAKTAKHESKNNRSASNRRRAPWYAVAAAALALVFLGGVINTLGTKLLQRTVSLTVSLDVNPSIEIRLNRQERVVAVVPLNEDAERIVGSMDFTGVPLDLTVNALIGSMVRNGYLGELANSVLVTVDEKDETRAGELTRYLASVIDEALAPQGGGAVIGFTAEHDSRLEGLAEKNGITLGKAMLIQKVIDTMPYYGFDELTYLNINELNALLDPKLADVTVIGTPRTNIISADEAALSALESTAFRDAVLTPISGGYVSPPVRAFRAEFRGSDTIFNLIADKCIDNGRLVWWVEFREGDMKYDIRVDADGSGAEVYKCPVWSSYYGLTPSHRSRLVSENEAVNAVLKGIEASASDIEVLTIRIGSAGSGDRMITVYTIEFNYSNASWTAQVNAETGEVLNVEQH